MSKKPNKINIAAWNVRTLRDTANSLQRRTTIVAQELQRYNIAIAALSETRLPDQTQFAEPGSGYTFFCSGRPENEPRQAARGLCSQDLLPQAS